MPARWMWEQRNKLNAGVNQYKLQIDKSSHVAVLKDSGPSIDLSVFRERYELLDASAALTIGEEKTKYKTTAHSDIQGMLLEIGHSRGFQTYCADRKPRFHGRALGEIATTKELPKFPGVNHDIVRKIAVVWLDKFFPTHAFEIELTTGIWPGLVRLGELRRLGTVFHVVTNDNARAFKRRLAGDIFAEIVDRCHHANTKEVHDLYELESRVSDLRGKLRF